MPDGNDRWSFYDVNTAPRPFDIVLCRFPYVENPHLLPNRRSPCLVRKVRVHTSEPKAYVTTVFGTSNIKGFERVNIDLVINKHTTLRTLGLKTNTRFDLADNRTLELPWAEEWFPIPANRHTPIIGSLDRSCIENLLGCIDYRKEKGIRD